MDSSSGSPIPLTAAILTFNSIAAVERAVQSLAGVDEILVCDGGSTDGTRELVAGLGCRVIDQDPACLDETGRLVNIAGVREQCLREAKHDWVLVIDSDEAATPELLDEIGEVVALPDGPGVYRVPRLFTLDDEVITCSMLYPSYQLRLVNRRAVDRYDGIVHDVPVMKEGWETGTLTNSQLVPEPPFRELWTKWRAYMRLEEIKKADLTRQEWSRTVLRPGLKLVKWFSYRYYKSLRTCRGRRLPARYELGRLAYELGVIFYTGRRFIGIRRASVDKAWG